MDNIKQGNLDCFIDLPNGIKDKSKLSIFNYESKIKKLTSKRLNIGFLDFVIYIFFKINMLEKDKEDIIRNSKKRKSLEIILNYPLKIKRWIDLLKFYIQIPVVIGDIENNKRSIKNFIFFLVFIQNIIKKVEKSSSRIKFRLRELNLKLVRLFIFNQVLREFAYFYGTFLNKMVYIIANMSNSYFKFCFITNNSVNAKFLTRYMGLKLKRKFPLFFVVNPLKKEFRKLANKKKEKKNNAIFKYFNSHQKFNYNYKTKFFDILIHLFKRYNGLYEDYYKSNKTLIRLDVYIFFLFLKKKYKHKNILMFYRKKLKKKYVVGFKLQWKYFFFELLKKKHILMNIYIKKLLFVFFSYIKNNILINLLYGHNRYHVDNVSAVFFALKGDIDTLFFFNDSYLWLIVYGFFFNNNYLNSNINNVSRFDLKLVLMSNYLLKSYIHYTYTQYAFNQFNNYINLNKKNYYLKVKNLFSSSSFILGYKMSFKGRFTRKQRASSVWYHQGFVPLNTIKGSIDYSFFTVPLKNSAISVKLWLYKNTNKVIWDSKFIDRI